MFLVKVALWLMLGGLIGHVCLRLRIYRSPDIFRPWFCYGGRLGGVACWWYIGPYEFRWMRL